HDDPVTVAHVGNIAMNNFGRQSLVAAVCLLLVGSGGVMAAPSADVQPATDTGMLGFTKSGAKNEHSLEKRFDALLSAQEMRAWLKRLSSEPNQVGSPHDKANAEFLLAQFKKWGWDAHIEKFNVLYP